MTKFWKAIKLSARLWLFMPVAVILAMIFVLALNYGQFYIHELGHANSVVLHTFTQHKSTVTMNFTYINYLGMESLKVPQQTIAAIPKVMLVYGVLFTIGFYSLIFLLLSRLKVVKGNKYLEYPLAAAFMLLILNDIISNLFCGTDGFNLSCNPFFVKSIAWIFSISLLVSLGIFFVMLINFIIDKEFITRLKNEARR